MTRSLILIRGARQLVTLHGPKEPRRGNRLHELNIVNDGALLIRDGIILHAGPSSRVERLAAARSALEIDVTGRVVMPAFVDGLARIAFAQIPLRSDEQILAGAERKGTHLTSDGVRSLSAIPALRLAARCRLIVEDMLRHGTGTLEAQTGSSLSAPVELKALRVLRALDGEPAQIIPTYTPAARFSSQEDTLLKVIAQKRLARFLDLRCSPEGLSTADARPFVQAARSLSFGLKFQAPGPASDEAVALAVEAGAVSVSHLNLISRFGVSLLSESTAIATLSPVEAFESRSDRFEPARALIENGAAIALASGFSAGSSPSYSMPFVLSLACKYMCMTPAEAISAATINGAYAAGRGASVGSLEPGKEADLIVCNAHDYREIPHFTGCNPVHMTIKKGVTVYSAAKVGAHG